MTRKKATQVKLKVLFKIVLEIQAKSKQLFLKYTQTLNKIIDLASGTLRCTFTDQKLLHRLDCHTSL